MVIVAVEVGHDATVEIDVLDVEVGEQLGRAPAPGVVDAEVELVVEVRLEGLEPRQVSLDGGRGARTVEVGTTPAWFELPVGGRPVDVVNNAGGVVFDDGYGADRGYLEVDAGQFDEPVEVFGWCGGGVMLRPS